MYLHKLKIGDVELDNNLILAPMAGITDRAFRIVAKDYGPGLVCTEMVSAKALYYKDEKTKLLLNIKDEKRPISMQLFGSDIESIKEATKYLNDMADIIDINMGCPAPKVTKNGDGSSLLRNLDLAEEIAKTVVEISTHPVTVKLRAGWDDENVVAPQLAKRLENAGVSAITIHGRTRKQFYSGKADLEIIKKVKDEVNIPVIGNGDINTPEAAIRMLEYTNVDGIMIGRASLGNPFIFKQIIEKLENKKNYDPTKEEKLETILKQIELETKEKGENIGIKELRKHLCAYIKGMEECAKMKEKINSISTKQELEKCIIDYFNNIY